MIYTNNNYIQNNKKYSFENERFKSPQNIINPFIRILFLGWCCNNHFILLQPQKSNIYNNPGSNINFLENNNNNKIYINSRKKKANDNDDKFKEYFANFVQNKFLIYPKINGQKVEKENRRYFSIFIIRNKYSFI